jgi:hypothetical protein
MAPVALRNPGRVTGLTGETFVPLQAVMRFVRRSDIHLDGKAIHLAVEDYLAVLSLEIVEGSSLFAESD